MTKHRIGPDALDTIYKNWKSYCGDASHVGHWSNIHNANLGYGLAREFDLYLWGCGGFMVQDNGKRYAEFFDEHNLTMFLLRWS